MYSQPWKRPPYKGDRDQFTQDWEAVMGRGDRPEELLALYRKATATPVMDILSDNLPPAALAEAESAFQKWMDAEVSYRESNPHVDNAHRRLAAAGAL